MISTQSAITRARRDLTIGTLLRGVLIAAAIGAVLLPPLLEIRIDVTLALTLVGAVWVVLGMQSMRGQRLVADSPALIATGQFDAAEEQISGALRSFSIFRAVKLLSLHQLAALRHAQNRWQESATLCQALLAQRKVAGNGLGKATQLILADALLEMDDTRGVGVCLQQLYRHRLSLGEAMSLLLVQLDYESRLGAFSSMMNEPMTKVSLAELMPTSKSARAQALLALAARRTGRSDWESWLRRRVELLIDPDELIAKRPILRELWTA